MSEWNSAENATHFATVAFYVAIFLVVVSIDFCSRTRGEINGDLAEIFTRNTSVIWLHEGRRPVAGSVTILTREPLFQGTTINCRGEEKPRLGNALINILLILHEIIAPLRLLANNLPKSVDRIYDRPDELSHELSFQSYVPVCCLFYINTFSF